MIVLAALIAPAPLRAQSARSPAADVWLDQVPPPRDDAYFFKDLPGSDQYVGPLDVLLNKGFNLAQASNRDTHIFSAPYGFDHVKNSLLNPGASINNTGG